MKTDLRLKNEIEHGKFIAQKGEEIWNWSSPAGKIRWERRCNLFRTFLGENNKKVLEIGCGTGLFTKELAKTNNQILAIDISSELIDLAKKRIQNANVVFKVENAYHTKFENNYFDAIVGSSVLHHLDVDLAIKEFYRILKPNGGIFFTEPNMANPQIALQKNISFLKKWAGDSPDETAFFKRALSKKILKMGFRDVSVVPFDFLHPAIPNFLIPCCHPLSDFFEKVPILRDIAGSLIIKGVK